MHNAFGREARPNTTLIDWRDKAWLLGGLAVLACGCSTKLVSDGKEDTAAGGAAGADGDAGGMTGSGGTTLETSSGSGGSSGEGASGGRDSEATSSGGTSSGGTSAGGTSSSGSGGGAGAPATGKALGESCSTDDDCDSGECADGVCCNESCDGVCMRCDASESLGTCVAAENDAACGELTCPESTECREYVPGDLASNCAGRGVCLTEAPCTVQDDPDGATCGTQADPGTCDGDGECVVPDKAGLGDSCNTDDDCGSQHCVTGVNGTNICCDSACDGVCEGCGSDGRCNVAPDDDDRCAVDCNNSTSCTTYPADPTNNRVNALPKRFTARRRTKLLAPTVARTAPATAMALVCSPARRTPAPAALAAPNAPAILAKACARATRTALAAFCVPLARA